MRPKHTGAGRKDISRDRSYGKGRGGDWRKGRGGDWGRGKGRGREEGWGRGRSYGKGRGWGRGRVRDKGRDRGRGQALDDNRRCSEQSDCTKREYGAKGENEGNTGELPCRRGVKEGS